MPQATSPDVNNTVSRPFENSEKTFYQEATRARVLNQKQYAITIGRTPAEVYAFLMDRQALGRVIKGVDRVDAVSETESRWAAHHNQDEIFEWTVRIDSSSLSDGIRWSALSQSGEHVDGEIELALAPNQLGTVVSLTLDHTTSGGKVAEWIAFIGGEDPATLAQVNLKRLKAYLETGEIPTTEGQTSGRDEDLIVQH